MEAANVYVNGKLIGTHRAPMKLVKEMKNQRRKGKISYQTNITYYDDTNEVIINTDAGRARRPLIVVENGKPKITEKQLKDLQAGKMTWDDLIAKGLIEYIDSEEEENTFIAITPEELTPEHTHLEIDPAVILGICSGVVPYPEHNSSPRNTMGAGMVKQALGFYTSNFKYR
ncbi:MAG: DNA-directed RNA polymerase subunit B, partial [Candidatus Hydrothermarchaeales archaeon]